jgi:hypothetical protein
MSNTTASQLEQLHAHRATAAARITTIERTWQEANERVANASAALAQAEREGATTARLRKAEDTLGTAKAKAAEPWTERLDGARAAARDADRQLREFTAANLGELVAMLEKEGQQTADRINAAASELIAAWSEWEAIATRIGATITLVTPPGPYDVSRSTAEQTARAAMVLINDGGANGPTLDRNAAPWDTLLGAERGPAHEPQAVAT